MQRPWRIIAIALFALALITGGLVGDRVLALNDEARDSLRLYTDLINVAHERYGGEVKFQDLVYASVQGMLRTLDPHTNFLSPRAYSGMRDRQQASFFGLGILVGTRNGQLTVISPIEGTPASRLGVRAGDIISTIEGEPTDSMTLDEAVQKLKGPKNTKVNITIVRRGLDEPLPLTVTREEISQTTVRQSYMLDERTGYLQISEFSRGTGNEVADALKALKEVGMERLLVDLRNNGGGLLDQAIEVSEQFLVEDSLIVKTGGRTRDSHQSFKASGRREAVGVPLVVLVNQGTASAAEILSGAIQDHDVGIIVGTPTWGKGLVQTVYSLSYGSGLALTTAKYYTPSGRLIQRDYSSYFDYYNYDPELDSETELIEEDRGAEDKDAYTTRIGREVYGGGGITPDLVVETDEVSPFELFLLTRNAFFEFAVDYRNRNDIKDPGWKPQPEILTEFRRWLVNQEIADGERLEEGFEDPGARAFALMQIRAQILNAAFGQEASHRVLARGDNQIQTALVVFDQAADLLERRKAFDGDALRQAAAGTAPGDA